MSNLSPDGRALLKAAREALRPKPQDRERVSAALRSRLGNAVLPATVNHASIPPAAHRSLFSLLSSVAVGASVVSAALYLAIHHSQKDVPLRHMPQTALKLPLPSSATLPSPQPSTAPPPEKHASDDGPVVSPRRSDRLAQEVAILSRAARDLRSGHAADALKAIDEHERRFPAGLLTEERRAAKAQALCMLGRFTDADVELARLSPQSPNATRARQICANRAARAPK